MSYHFKKNNYNGVLRGSVLFYAFVLIFLGNVPAYAFEARVKHVIDGDTFILEDNRSVRLASIDTPEIGRDGKKDQYFAREAKDVLTRLIAGRTVRIDLTHDQKDHYKRLVGWVYVDGKFLNEYMVREGYAFFYYHKNNEHKFQNIILQAQRKAYKSKKGFWPVVMMQKQFNKLWIGNKKSRRCFPESDKFAKRISLRNRVLFTNLGEGFKQGYSPARHVDFWPVAD